MSDQPPGRGPDIGRDPLADLHPDVQPPPDLRADVVARLRREGMLAPAQAAPMWPRIAAAVAALALAFVGGRVSAGTAGAPAPVQPVVPDDAWALLLYEDARFQPGDLGPAELYDAYAAWADDARDAGVLVLAEKLGDVEAELHGGAVTRRAVIGGPAPGVLTGLYVVTAASEEAALALARETPHHALGGSIVVRAIGPD